MAAHVGAEPHRAGLFCDFDGTLVPIVDDPAASRLHEDAARVLAALATRLRVVALVSGRPAAFLGTRADVPGVRLLGVYGLEEWRDGEAVARPEAAAWEGVVRAAVEELAAIVGDLPGVEVEDKGLSVALHWRNAADREHAAVEVARIMGGLARRTGLRREPGKLVDELRPPVDWDKGSAVVALACEAGLRRLVYVGDDKGDLAAFAAARELGGLSVAVDHGEETPPDLVAAADVVVTGHGGVRALLSGLARHLEAP